MGKVRPSILNGLFSHLNFTQKKPNSKYKDIGCTSPDSKVHKKGKRKKILQNLSERVTKTFMGGQADHLLSPKTPITKKSVPKKSAKSGLQQVIDKTKKALPLSKSYNEIVESPTQSLPSGSSFKREKYKNSKNASLRERMLKRLTAARFRYMNEQLYVTESKGADELFKQDPGAFKAYHDGYKQQVAQWPVNPLDMIIKSLIKRAKSGKLVVADFGCGEARLAQALPCTVHSLDLVALNERVTACDMAHTHLATASIDVVVFCLSLMGTNIVDYIKEANRVLKENGIMKIAEIESRFEDLNQFISGVQRLGFESVSQDLSHNLFYFLDFKKKSNISKKKKKIIPELSLKPCLYKRR